MQQGFPQGRIGRLPLPLGQTRRCPPVFDAQLELLRRRCFETRRWTVSIHPYMLERFTETWLVQVGLGHRWTLCQTQALSLLECSRIGRWTQPRCWHRSLRDKLLNFLFESQ